MENLGSGLFIVGFGSLGIGWILQHTGDAIRDKYSHLELVAYALYGLGFLISSLGAAMALDAARDPSNYMAP